MDTRTTLPTALDGPMNQENRIVNFNGSADWRIDIDSLKGETVEVKINKAFSNSLFGVLLENQLEHLKTEGDQSYVA